VGFSEHGLFGLHSRLRAYVERGDVPGLVALIARGSDVHVEVLGTLALDDAAPLGRDAIFRIASISKPIGAAGAMVLVDDGVLAPDDPVETFLPELADRRVLHSIDGPLDDTVPAERSITVDHGRSRSKISSPSASGSATSWPRPAPLLSRGRNTNCN
jgi:CubicO group peptidase (beta-lactamase class C family)